MSKVKIEGNASGTGTLTISAPNTNTDRTLTLPDGAGEILTDAGLKTINGSSIVGSGDLEVGGGKVLQVVSSRFTAQGTVSLSQSDYTTNPSITKSITPVESGSSFLIYIRWFGETANGESTVAHIYRDSSRINEANTNLYHGLSLSAQSGTTSDLDSTPQIMHLQTLDETGSTAGTSITYTLKYSSAGTGSMYTNRVASSSYGSTHYETGVSEIIITEIGA